MITPAGGRPRSAVRRAHDLEAIASARPVEFEEMIPDAGDERTHISLAFPIPGPAGAPYAVGGISTDVSEQRRGQRCLVIQHAVTRALAASGTTAEARSGTLEAVCATLGWDVGLYWRVDPVARCLRCAEVWQASGVRAAALERLSRRMTLSPGMGLAGQVWAAGEPIWVETVVAREDCPRAAAALVDGLHGACGFPVRNGGEVLGVMEFFSRAVWRPDRDLTRLMVDVGGQVSQFNERKQLQRALHERDREFSLARAIQFALLPPRSPVVPGFAIGGMSRPAQEPGGDYFDYIPFADGSLGIAIGDASGHGIGAALVVAAGRAYLRAGADTDADVGRVLTRVNRHRAADVPEGHFVTLFLARLDARTRTLTYSSAGHGPDYVLDARGEVREVLGSTNFPLGVDAADYPVAPPVVLGPGEIVLLLTDGIAEAMSPAGEQFGVRRALAVVRESHHDSPDGILTALLRAVRAFSAAPQVDDMTAVVIKVDPPEDRPGD